VDLSHYLASSHDGRPHTLHLELDQYDERPAGKAIKERVKGYITIEISVNPLTHSPSRIGTPASAAYSSRDIRGTRR